MKRPKLYFNSVELSSCKTLHDGSLTVTRSNKGDYYLTTKILEFYVKTYSYEELLPEIKKILLIRDKQFLEISGVSFPNEEDSNHFVFISKIDECSMFIKYTSSSTNNLAFMSCKEEVELQSSTLNSFGFRYKCLMCYVFGLKFLHDKNIIYKRLSLTSLVINKDMIPKLWDFYESTLISSYMYFDKCHENFLAPEVKLDFLFTKMADIYSLGVIISELFTDKERYGVLNILYKQCTSVVPENRPTIDKILDICLENSQMLSHEDRLEVEEYMKYLTQEDDSTIGNNDVDIYISFMSRYFTDIKKYRYTKNPRDMLLLGEMLVNEYNEQAYGYRYISNASKGNLVEAHIKLCEMHSKKDSIFYDIDKWTKLCEKISHMDSDLAYKFAEYLASKDLKKAYKYYKLAAEKDHPEALLKYALHIKETDPKMYFRYVKRSSDLNISEAIYQLAFAYLNGKGTPKSLRKCLQTISRLSDKRTEIFIEEIREVSKRNTNNTNFKKRSSNNENLKLDRLIMFAIAITDGLLGFQKDVQTSRQILELTASKGYAEAQYELSKILFSQNENKIALDYLLKAVINSFPDALIYYSNIVNDKEEKLKLLERAAKTGSPEGQYLYGVLSGNVSYIESSAEQYHPMAFYNLGRYYQINSNIDLAIKNYEIGMQYRVYPAMHALADIYVEQKRYNEAFSIYKNLYDLREFSVSNKLADLYISGLGVEQCFEKAHEILNNGIKSNCAHCKLSFAKLLFRGFGIKMDQEEAVKIFISLKDELVNSCNALGYAYYFGMGINADKKKAAECFKECYQKYEPCGTINYALMVKNGEIPDYDGSFIKILQEEYVLKHPLACYLMAKEVSSTELYHRAGSYGHIPSLAVIYSGYNDGSNDIEELKKLDQDPQNLICLDWLNYRDDFIIMANINKSIEDYNAFRSRIKYLIGRIYANTDRTKSVSFRDKAKEYFQDAANLGESKAYRKLEELLDVRSVTVDNLCDTSDTSLERDFFDNIMDCDVSKCESSDAKEYDNILDLPYDDANYYSVGSNSYGDSCFESDFSKHENENTMENIDDKFRYLSSNTPLKPQCLFSDLTLYAEETCCELD